MNLGPDLNSLVPLTGQSWAYFSAQKFETWPLSLFFFGSVFLCWEQHNVHAIKKHLFFLFLSILVTSPRQMPMAYCRLGLLVYGLITHVNWIRDNDQITNKNNKWPNLCFKWIIDFWHSVIVGCTCRSRISLQSQGGPQSYKVCRTSFLQGPDLDLNNSS